MGVFHSKSKGGKPKTRAPPGGTITPADRATLDLKVSRDKLAKYRTKLELDSDKLAKRAKALRDEGKTKQALQLLRLRKHKLKEADRVEEQLLTVLRMVDKISEKKNEQEVVNAMKRGKDALQIMHDEMGIDDVLDLMDEVRDQGELEGRINEILGGEGLADAMEEEDVLAELEELEREVLGTSSEETEKRKASQTPAGGKEEEEEGEVALPEPPTAPLPAVEEPAKEPARVAVAS